MDMKTPKYISVSVGSDMWIIKAHMVAAVFKSKYFPLMLIWMLPFRSVPREVNDYKLSGWLDRLKNDNKT